MDAKQRQRYLESKGSRCPFCNSNDIQGEVTISSSDYDESYEQPIYCNECGKTWKDIYTLTDVEEMT